MNHIFVEAIYTHSRSDDNPFQRVSEMCVCVCASLFTNFDIFQLYCNSAQNMNLEGLDFREIMDD